MQQAQSAADIALSSSVAASSSNAIPLDYKTPEQTYRDALNFATTATTTTTTTAAAAAAAAAAGGNRNDGLTAKSMQGRLRAMLCSINDSQYLYPSVAVLTLVVCVIIVLLQKSCSFLVKCLFVVILLVFIIYTVFQFKDKMTSKK